MYINFTLLSSLYFDIIGIKYWVSDYMENILLVEKQSERLGYLYPIHLVWIFWFECFKGAVNFDKKLSFLGNNLVSIEP